MASKQSIGRDDGPGNSQVPRGVIAQAEAVAASSSNIVGGPSFDEPMSGSASGADPGISFYQGPSTGSAKPIHTCVYYLVLRRLALTVTFSSSTPATGTVPGASGTLAGFAQEVPIEEVPPPIYSETYGEMDLSQDGFTTQAYIASMRG